MYIFSVIGIGKGKILLMRNSLCQVLENANAQRIEILTLDMQPEPFTGRYLNY
jgi:hypothetical protein